MVPRSGERRHARQRKLHPGTGCSSVSPKQSWPFELSPQPQACPVVSTASAVSYGDVSARKAILTVAGKRDSHWRQSARRVPVAELDRAVRHPRPTRRPWCSARTRRRSTWPPARPPPRHGCRCLDSGRCRMLAAYRAPVFRGVPSTLLRRCPREPRIPARVARTIFSFVVIISLCSCAEQQKSLQGRRRGNIRQPKEGARNSQRR